MAVPIIAAAAAVTFIVARHDPAPGLGGISAPAFAGAPLRASGQATPTDEGMAAYAAGDYRRAADLLERASAADSSPAVGFYLGLARLMTGDANGALRALALPRSADGSPYQFDAILFAAKAYLRLGHDDSALALLRSIPAGAAGDAHARALVDSILKRRK